MLVGRCVGGKYEKKESRALSLTTYANVYYLCLGLGRVTARLACSVRQLAGTSRHLFVVIDIESVGCEAEHATG